jgi:hypothetical protein
LQATCVEVLEGQRVVTLTDASERQRMPRDFHVVSPPAGRGQTGLVRRARRTAGSASRIAAIVTLGCSVLHVPATDAGTSSTVEVIEYYDASRDHYFMTSLTNETEALDAGRFPGWRRTGLSFRAYARPTGDAKPVCRFYIPPAWGDSHFYSALPDECAMVAARFPFFQLESPAVTYIDVPDAATGACPVGYDAVYRLWNRRLDTNHRYTTSVAKRARMMQAGWLPEGYGPQGVAFCAPPVTDSPPQMVFMKSTSGAMAPGPGTTYEVAVMNLDGSGFRQLTHDGKMKMLPHFSPDGTRIAYTRYAFGSYGDPHGVYDIAVLDAATGVETVITHDGHDANATWSPDGRRIAYVDTAEASIWTVDADGANAQRIASARATPDDRIWGDLAWSRDDWLLFTVGQTIDGCFKVRLDKIRPDGSQRTRVTDGGPYCTPPGYEQSGDADPGWSADGRTIYTSRGFPVPPAGLPSGAVERKLYAVSSDAWYPGKPEMDLSLPSQPSCVEGVPKGSPDGARVLLFRACFDHGPPAFGIYLTDRAGTYRSFVTDGFGPDWNPAAVR